MIHLEKFGRFGNNVQQLLHAIHIALTQGHSKITFHFPEFSKREIVLGHLNPNEKQVYDTCYYITIKPTWDQYKEYAKYVRPLVIKEQPPFSEKQLEEDLFVHIRSGDIFDPRPHNLYVQPPLAYYKAIFAKHPEKAVHVLCEDERNPVIGALKSLGYPIHILSLRKTIGTFLIAKNIVCGNGTFIPALTLLGNPTCLYIPISETCSMVSPDAIRVQIPNYIPVGQWKADAEQRSLMLTYNDTISF